MVWIGLVIGLLSALVASVSELKYPEGVRPWSRAFFGSNRLKFASAGLAVLGFAVAALTYRQEQARSEAAERHLQDENDVLKSLMLSGRQVSPVVRIVIATGAALDPTPPLDELGQWMHSGAATQLPKAIGFVPSEVRAELFRGAQPTLALKSAYETIPLRPAQQTLGYVDLTADDVAEHKLRYQFSVGTDGSALSEHPGPSLRDLETSVFAMPNHKRAVVFEFRVNDSIEALELFRSSARVYERGFRLLAIRVATRSCRAENLKQTHRMARAWLSLDERSELWVSAVLQEATPGCESDGETRYEWKFDGPPTLAVSRPGGLM